MDPKLERILNEMPLGYSTRMKNFCVNHDIRSVSELLACDRREILRAKNIGRGTFRQLKRVLTKNGLDFSKNHCPYCGRFLGKP